MAILQQIKPTLDQYGDIAPMLPYSPARYTEALLHPLEFRRLHIFVLCLALSCVFSQKSNAATTTTISLVLSAQSVPAGNSITATAKVIANGVPVTLGQVIFCDASTTRCEDTAVLGTAQLDNAGTATFTHFFSPGSHGLYALFRGTVTNASSKSTIQTLEVTGKLPSSTIFQKAASNNGYTLTATVVGQGKPALTGDVEFFAAAKGNQSVGSSNLGTSTLGYGFTDKSFYPVSPSPLHGAQSDFSQFRVADLNNDGIPDLITISFFQQEQALIQIQLADPSHPGQYQAPLLTTLNAAGWVFDVVFGDFNHDGFLDMAVLDAPSYYSFPPPYTGQIHILLADPSHPGQFVLGGSFDPKGSSESMVAGDFNGDGILDLAVTNNYEQLLSILIGDPAHPGSFLPAVTYPAAGPTQIVSGDFNGDGFIDLAIEDIDSSSTSIDLYTNDPAHPGQFLAGDKYPVPARTYDGALVSGDFNQDGIPDLVLAETSNTRMLLSDPSHPGIFLPSKEYPATGDDPVFALGDYNGDGILDLAFTVPSGDAIGIRYGDPKNPGSLSPISTFPSSRSGIAQIRPVDLNGDGLTDLAELTVNSSDSSKTIGTVSNTVTETATTTPVTIKSSGADDFVYAHYYGSDTYYGSTSCSIDLSSSTPTAPSISGIIISNITSQAATIQWTTNIPTNGYVKYGENTPEQQTPWLSQLSTNHAVTLTGLTPGTTYAYQIGAVTFYSGCAHWTTFSPASTFNTFAQ